MNFKNVYLTKKDSETIEICTEIKRNRNLNKLDLSSNLHENRNSITTVPEENSDKYLNEINERIKSDVVYDSMKSYLSNITNIAVGSVYPNDESEHDDETSIQEIIKLSASQNQLDGENKSNKI